MPEDKFKYFLIENIEKWLNLASIEDLFNILHTLTFTHEHQDFLDEVIEKVKIKLKQMTFDQILILIQLIDKLKFNRYLISNELIPLISIEVLKSEDRFSSINITILFHHFSQKFRSYEICEKIMELIQKSHIEPKISKQRPAHGLYYKENGSYFILKNPILNNLNTSTLAVCLIAYLEGPVWGGEKADIMKSYIKGIIQSKWFLLSKKAKSRLFHTLSLRQNHTHEILEYLKEKFEKDPTIFENSNEILTIERAVTNMKNTQDFRVLKF